MSGGYSPRIHLACQRGGKPRWSETHHGVPRAGGHRRAGLSQAPPPARRRSPPAWPRARASLPNSSPNSAAPRRRRRSARSTTTARRADQARSGASPTRTARPSSISRTTCMSTISASPCARAMTMSNSPNATPPTAWRPTRASSPTSTPLAFSPRRAASRLPRSARRRSGRSTRRSRSASWPGRIADRHFNRRAVRRSRVGRSRHGARFVETGLWMRSSLFSARRRKRIGARASTAKRQAVRSAVGLCDVSTLGKIEIVGPDAGALLDRIYSNPFAKLAVGQGALRSHAARRRFCI